MASIPDPLPASVLNAIQRGSAIEAIRLLRESTGLGLKEARDVVNRPLRDAATPPSKAASTGGLPSALATALRSGDPAGALRAMRDKKITATIASKTGVASTPAPARTPLAPNGLAPGEVPRSSHRLSIAALLVALALLLHAVFARLG